MARNGGMMKSDRSDAIVQRINSDLQAGLLSEEGPGDVLEMEATMTAVLGGAHPNDQPEDARCWGCDEVELVLDPFVGVSPVHIRCTTELQQELLSDPLLTNTERRILMENLHAEPYDLLATMASFELS